MMILTSLRVVASGANRNAVHAIHASLGEVQEANLYLGLAFRP